MKAHIDAKGSEIKPGDWVVYSASGGRSALLKFGKVAALAKSKERPRYSDPGDDKYISVVSLDYWSGYLDRWDVQNNGKPVRLAMSERVLIIPVECVPPRAVALLESGQLIESKQYDQAVASDLG